MVGRAITIIAASAGAGRRVATVIHKGRMKLNPLAAAIMPSMAAMGMLKMMPLAVAIMSSMVAMGMLKMTRLAMAMSLMAAMGTLKMMLLDVAIMSSIATLISILPSLQLIIS